MGWFPLGLGLVMEEDGPSKLSCAWLIYPGEISEKFTMVKIATICSIILYYKGNHIRPDVYTVLCTTQ